MSPGVSQFIHRSLCDAAAHRLALMRPDR